MVLKDCPRCLVYTPAGERLTEARVVHTDSTVTLFFDTYSMKDAKVRTRIDFYDEMKGLVVAFCSMVVRRNTAFPDMPEPWMGECKILEVKNVVQRQQDVRVRVHIETDFYSDKHGSFFGTIENLSAGGFFVVTSQTLSQNERITFSYRFRTEMRTFQAEALRAKKVPGGKYGYGCRFLNLTDGADAAIRNYVYKAQMKKKEKDDN